MALQPHVLGFCDIAKAHSCVDGTENRNSCSLVPFPNQGKENSFVYYGGGSVGREDLSISVLNNINKNKYGDFPRLTIPLQGSQSCIEL